MERQTKIILIGVIVFFIVLSAGFTILSIWNKTNRYAYIESYKVNESKCQNDQCVVPAGEPMLVDLEIRLLKSVENFQIHTWGVWSAEENQHVIDHYRYYENLGAGRLVENFKTRSYCSACVGVKPGVNSLYTEIKSGENVLDNRKVSIYISDNSN